MNNFVFSGNDPLLYNTMSTMQSRQIPQEMDVRQQLDNALAQYHQVQQNLMDKHNSQERQSKDYLGELDEMMKELDEDVMAKLQMNEEFSILNSEVQQMIQEEIMRSVRWKINSNPEAISKIDNMKKLIRGAQKEQQIEEKKNMMELNDYITNYSSMSFDEYKRIKSTK